MSTTTFPSRAALAVATALATLAAPPAMAEPGQQGMVVVRDPQSGHMRPATPAEARALLDTANKSRAARPQEAPRPPNVRPDGVRAATLGEKGMVYSVITRGPDGKLAEQCIEGEAAAAHAMHKQSTAQPAKEHNHE
jgi:hypothetical protein